LDGRSLLDAAAEDLHLVVLNRHLHPPYVNDALHNAACPGLEVRSQLLNTARKLAV
jgi:hypothetical protein